jgi:hypothetical protein
MADAFMVGRYFFQWWWQMAGEGHEARGRAEAEGATAASGSRAAPATAAAHSALTVQFRILEFVVFIDRSVSCCCGP